jgi:hypothetical protein
VSHSGKKKQDLHDGTSLMQQSKQQMRDVAQGEQLGPPFLSHPALLSIFVRLRKQQFDTNMVILPYWCLVSDHQRRIHTERANKFRGLSDPDKTVDVTGVQDVFGFYSISLQVQQDILVILGFAY